jgi:hypothetical protein
VSEHIAENDAPDYGTVTLEPYVGDSPVAVAKCRHGDYDRMFKGAAMDRARKALAEHYAAKHSVLPPGKPGVSRGWTVSRKWSDDCPRRPRRGEGERRRPGGARGLHEGD